MSGFEIVVTVLREGGTPFDLGFRSVPVTIGASVHNDVVLDHPAVSARHALVTVARGRVLFVDQSTNGSFFEAEAVKNRYLEDKDVISIPPFRLQFSFSAASVTRATAERYLPAAVTAEIETEPERPLETPAAAATPCYLRPIEGAAGGPEEDFFLPDEPVLIGRGPQADLVLRNPAISRSHARLSRRVEGSYWLEDLESANGTQVNGEKIRAVALTPGDRILLGGSVAFEFRAAELLNLSLRPRRPSAGREVLILDLVGRLDGYTYAEFTEAFERAVDQGDRLIVVNLAGLGFIDHAGLGALVKALTLVENLGGQLRLVGVSQRLRETFTLSRLDSILRGRIHHSEHSAFKDLAPFRRSSSRR